MEEHRQRRSTFSKKLNYELLKKELPFVIPFLWVPRLSRISHVSKIHRTLLLRPSHIRTIDEFLYMANDIYIPNLLWATAHILKEATSSSGAVVYLVDQTTNELFINPFVGDNQSNRVSWTIQSDTTIAAYVADTKQSVMINDLKSTEPFNGYDWKGLTVSATIAIPIIMRDNDCFAVLEFYRRDGINYTLKNLKTLTTVGHMLATSIEHNRQRLRMQIRQQMETYLFEIIQHYFTNLGELQHLVEDILHFSKESLCSARSVFFVFDDDNKLSCDTIKTQTDQCIAEFTLNMNRMLNIQDAYHDTRFTRIHDTQDRHITRTALSVPLVGRNNRILGVIMFVNKLHGHYTTFDEELLQIIANFCVLAIERTNLHRSSLHSEKLKSLYNEVYFYHTNNENAKPLILKSVTSADIPIGIDEFKFYPSCNDNLVDLTCWLLKSLPMEPLEILKFVTCVRNGYRNVPYHNFEHAFNVLHNAKCILDRNSEKFSRIEKIAFLIATICHDIDHQALTNNFLEISDSPLTALYDESPMENHHCFITLILIEKTTLRKSFNRQEYKNLLALIEEIILATDLTRHLEDRSRLDELCNLIRQKGDSVWQTNDEYRSIVRGLIATASDLSGQSKNFEVAQQITKNLMLEFYAEGEQLKELGHEPLPSMDLKYIMKVPQIQVQFIEIICIPCFDFLQIILPNTHELLSSSKILLATWREVVKIRASLMDKRASNNIGDHAK